MYITFIFNNLSELYKKCKIKYFCFLYQCSKQLKSWHQPGLVFFVILFQTRMIMTNFIKLVSKILLGFADNTEYYIKIFGEFNYKITVQSG